MKTSKWSYFLAIIFALGNLQQCLADTGLDGAVTINSSFTLTGPVYISSVTITSGTVSSLSVSSMTSNLNMNSLKVTNLANGTNTADAVAFGQLKVLYTTQCTTTSPFTTTSASYQTTNLTCSITPTSSSHYVFVMALGTLVNNAANDSAFATIARNGTNVVGGYLAVNNIASPLGNYAPTTLIYTDFPATTSNTTYSVQIKDDGTHAASWGVNSSGTQVMILMEVVP